MILEIQGLSYINYGFDLALFVLETLALGSQTPCCEEAQRVTGRDCLERPLWRVAEATSQKPKPTASPPAEAPDMVELRQAIPTGPVHIPGPQNPRAK